MTSSPARPIAPALAPGTVVYGVVPQRFGPRGYADVTARLDELGRLGVGTLWLAPPTLATPGDYGYEVVDHRAPRTDSGSTRDLRRLVAAAHGRGMHVIADFVPNHLHDSSPLFERAQREGAAGSAWAWFERDADGAPRHYFDWEHLPNLNYDRPEVREHMLESMRGWVREYDFDGFRLDAAWGVAERNPGLWKQWNTALKREFPGLAMLAEADAHDPRSGREGFDAAYDWSKLGRGALDQAFDGTRVDVAKLRSALRATTSTTPLRFLENNDTGTRFVGRHGARLARLAATMLMTAPGLPLIYTGQEVGAHYQPYSELTPISWHDRHNLRATYEQLARLRADLPPLRTGATRVLDVRGAADDAIVGYDRTLDGSTVRVLLNFSDQAHQLPLSRPAHDAITGAQLTGGRGKRVEIAPKSFRILKLT